VSARAEIERRAALAADLVRDIRDCEDTLDQLLSVREVPLAVPSGFFRTSSAPREPLPPRDAGALSRQVGEKIRAARERRGMTQRELSELTGIKRPNIARLERGSGLPNLATLLRVANGLGVTLASFLG